MAIKPFPILFIGPSRIGDAVLASGLIKKLADEAPGARFTIAVGPAAAPLFAEVPGLDRLIVMQKQKGSGHWLALWNQVRHTHWALVIDMRGSAITSFLKKRKRAVFRRQPGPQVHKVIQAARVLQIEDEPAAPYLFTSAETEAEALSHLAGEGPILALAPAANWVGKTWPLERFSQVAIHLLGEEGPLSGGRLMVLGGPDDARSVASLRVRMALLPSHAASRGEARPLARPPGGPRTGRRACAIGRLSCGCPTSGQPLGGPSRATLR